MFSIFPEIYPDETMYSWFARYNAHTGYRGYVSAGADLLENRRRNVNVEFSGRLKSETGELFDSMYGMRNLIMEHTMFPQYARFASQERREKALEALMENSDEFYALLRFPKSQIRTIRYCLMTG